jgi:predicted dithiol-disulfide oxidoreductase (DUF899 family)
MVADQVAHVAHLNARDTTLAFVSRAPQADIARLKARMGWEIPWFTSGTASTPTSAWASGNGTKRSHRDGDRVFRTYFINSRDGGSWGHLELPRHPLGRQEVGRIPAGYPQTPTYKWWNFGAALRRRHRADEGGRPEGVSDVGKRRSGREAGQAGQIV